MTTEGSEPGGASRGRREATTAHEAFGFGAGVDADGRTPGQGRSRNGRSSGRDASGGDGGAGEAEATRPRRSRRRGSRSSAVDPGGDSDGGSSDRGGSDRGENGRGERASDAQESDLSRDAESGGRRRRSRSGRARTRRRREDAPGGDARSADDEDDLLRRGASRRRRRGAATESRGEAAWQPPSEMREASAVDFVHSRRCDERGALVVEVDVPRRDHLDPNALRVVSRLARAGFEAYLVGGCVRDLLLGRRPKDFDVATEAHPREIKKLFRNGRIIGRRFKLVHVVYGQDVVETSTFRAAPKNQLGESGDDPTVDDLIILDDNEFGTAAEDARRRDFTINGLFLDPIEGEIIDYVDGLEDLENKLLRTIGDPRVRIAEDPVRILRAIKFASRLGFGIEPATARAMEEHAPGLARSAAPRVVEEVVRLLASGCSAKSFELLERYGALPVLLPELSAWARGAADEGTTWSVLDALDERIAHGEVPSIAFSLAALFAPAFVERWEHEGSPEAGDAEAVGLAARLLAPLSQVARLSRHDVSRAKRLLANQRRFVQSPSRRFRPLVFVHSPEFEESLDLLALRVKGGDEDPELLDRWRNRVEEARDTDPEVVERELGKRRRRRRRRKSSGGGSGGRSDSAPDAG